jgi:hypothetical protein
MKTLKQKWIDALPVLAIVFFAIGIVFLLVWGIYKLSTLPSIQDNRTIQQVIEDRYKGGFYMICSNESNFKHYISGLLSTPNNETKLIN